MNDPKTVARLKALRQEIDALLTSIPDRLEGWDGLKLKLGNCRYDTGGSFTFKIEGTLPDGVNKEEQVYNDLVKILALPAHKYIELPDGKHDFKEIPGFTLPPLGTVMSVAQQLVKIVGGRARAKFNVIVEKQGGKRTCYKAEDIARLWAAQKGAA